MAKSFLQKRAKNLRTAYNYRPDSSLSDQERAVNFRLVLGFVLIIAIALGLYFWGIELVAQLSGVWRQVLPNTQIFEADQSGDDSSNKVLFAPRIDPLPVQTKEAQVDIKGWSQPGVEVKILNNMSEVATILADKSGRFEYSAVKLNEGENTISATAIDNSGTSDPSASQIVYYDLVPPKFTANVLKDQIDERGKLKIQGDTEPNVDLFVNDRRVIMNNDNTFNFEMQLVDGKNEIIIHGVDLAGNETKVTETIEYTLPTPTQTEEDLPPAGSEITE